MSSLIMDEDYQLVPTEHENSQAWSIRILKGEFAETVIRYGNIAIDPEDDCLKFNFMIEYSPNEDLTTDDIAVQNYVADVLEGVLEQAIADGSFVTSDSNEEPDED